MRCSTCHRDQPEALFRGARRLLVTCAACREVRAAARRAARDRAEPRIALDLAGPRSTFRARLHHADPRDLLGSCERPDLIVTEPPYGADRESEKGRGDRDTKLAYAVLGLAIRRLKPGG